MKRLLMLTVLLALSACSTSEFTRVGNSPTEPLPESTEGFTRIGNPPTNPLPGEHFGAGKAAYFAGSTTTIPEYENYLVKVTDDGATITSTDFPQETNVGITFGLDGAWSTDETVTGVKVTGVMYDAHVVDANGIEVAKLVSLAPSDPEAFLGSADTEAKCIASATKCFDLDAGGSKMADYFMASHVRSSVDNANDCSDKIYDACVGSEGDSLAKSDMLAERVCVANGENGPLHYATLHVKCDCENGRCTGNVSDILYPSDMLKSSSMPTGLKPGAPMKLPVATINALNALMLPPIKPPPAKLDIGPALK